MAEPDRTNADAERVSNIVPVAWMVTRPGNNGTVFPKLYLLEADADAMVAYVTVNPPANKVALYTADIIEAQSKALAEARAVKPLQWGSEAPYLVARTRQGAHYSIEVMRDEDGNNPLIWTGGSFGSTTGKYLTVEAAKAAAQADYERRILSALTPTPENPNG